MTDQERKTDARTALLRAAHHLFTEKGYEAVSTRELAESAGVNLGAIQYHFGSKGKLFVEALHHCFVDAGYARSAALLEQPGTSRQEAAIVLTRFVLAAMRSLLRPEGLQPCRLMFREIFSPASADPELSEALVSSVVRDIIQPTDAALGRLIQVLCPGVSAADEHRFINSLVGQYTFYFTHAPFLARLRGAPPAESPELEQAAAHVAEFSMRGMGVPETLIEAALAEVYRNAEQR